MNAAWKIVEAELDWEPAPEIVQWAAGMVRRMKQGGAWMVPMNGSVYSFDHARKTLWLVAGPLDDVFFKNRKVFGKLGWQVLSRAGGEDEHAFAE